MRRTELAVSVLVASGLVGSAVAQAVCLDPKTDLSGYHIPLNDELASSYAVVVGEVTKEHRLTDGSTHSEFFEATIYTVRIIRTLKGKVAQTVTLRTQNDSGRYSMSVGEKHLLFLSRLKPGLGADYYADSCGSSETLPQGSSTLHEVEARLNGQAHAL